MSFNSYNGQIIRFIDNKCIIRIVICILPKIKIIIMSTGTVKFFNNSKGFGFIKDCESEKEYFVHVSGLNDEVRENDEVSFDLQEGKKGLNAINVKLV